MQDKTNIGIEAALELVQNAFIASGLNEQSAQSVARALVMAEAEGQVGHGFSRVGDYVAQMKSGKINTNAAPSVISQSPSYLHVSANNGFAYPALDLAIDQAIQMAIIKSQIGKRTSKTVLFNNLRIKVLGGVTPSFENSPT